MKRVILFGALALAAASTAANAALIIGSTDTPAGTGANTSAFDEITFTVTGWTGTDATTPNNGVNGINGTFSAVGAGAVLSVPGTAATFKNFITNVQGGVANPPKSYANFENVTASSRNPSASVTPTSVTATWFTLGTTPDPAVEPAGFVSLDTRIMPVDTDAGKSDDNGFDNTLLAQIFVTPGAQVSFAGTDGATAGVEPLNFTSATPEPASLGLLAVGIGGLLARRRK